MPSDFAREKALAVYNQAPEEWDELAQIPGARGELALSVKTLSGA
jgi:hypothetical protein